MISPGKSDILRYYGGADRPAHALPTSCSRSRPGLCDALFRAAAADRTTDEPVLIGLPDTIWFPEDGFAHCRTIALSFLLFPVERPGALRRRGDRRRTGACCEIQVKQRGRGVALDLGRVQDAGPRLSRAARALARARAAATNTSARWSTPGWRAAVDARGVRAGDAYVDVGTLHGYREAIRLLSDGERPRRVCRASSAMQAPRCMSTRLRDRVRNRRDAAFASSATGFTISTWAACGPRPTISSATIRRQWQTFRACAAGGPDAARRVLDIGCNGGFYSIEMKRRGADRVRRHRLRSRLSGAGAVRGRGARGSRSSSASSRSTTWRSSARGSTSCSSWACSTTCAIRCSRST